MGKNKNKKQEPEAEQEQVETQVVSETPVPKTAPEATPNKPTNLAKETPQPQVKVNEPTPVPQPSREATPYKTPDEFAKRDFTLPKPKSFSELLTHLSPYKLGLLTSSGRSDGSLLKTQRGFYKSGNDFLKIVVDRFTYKGEVTTVVSLQEKPGEKLKMWSQLRGELKAYNFNRDFYSTVLVLADGKVIYTKWVDDFVMKDGVRVSAMKGWLWSSTKPNATCFPAAFLDEDGPKFKHFSPGSDQNEADFPNLKILNPLWEKCPASN